MPLAKGSVLHLGCRGREVECLQELLNNWLRHSRKLHVDGNFGPLTATAVRRYQASVGIGVDGVVGTDTWSALQQGGVVKKIVPAPVPLNFVNAPWMAIAMREQGQEEMDGPDHNPRILEYHSTTTLRASTDETPWCSSFVNWCLRKAGINGTSSATARSWLHWGMQVSAIPGAITIIHNDAAAGSSLTMSGYHVGFLVQDTGSHYRLLGGNQSDQVKITYYPKHSWRGVAFRWPN